MKKAPPPQRKGQRRPSHAVAPTSSARPHQQPHARGQRGRESAWRRQLRRHLTARNVFLLGCALVLCLAVTAVLRGTFNAGSPADSGHTVTSVPIDAAGQADTSGPCKSAGTYVSEKDNVVLCLARPQLYTYHEKLLGLMAPAFDQQNHLWVGAMAANGLLRLDPRTGQSQSWPVPNGQHMVMETAVDRHGSVWFTEQAAGYIGRFDPASGAFTQYTLDPISGGNGERPGPQAL